MIASSQAIPKAQHARKKCIRRDKFLPSEDKFINDLVARFGYNWDVISNYFGSTRTKRQIKERWQNYLNPENISVFSKEEDELLLTCVEKYGQKWSKIAIIIGTKSAVQCRNRHRVLMKKKSENCIKSNFSNSDSSEKINLSNKSHLNSIDSSDQFNCPSIDFAFDTQNLDDIFQNYEYLFNETIS